MLRSPRLARASYVLFSVAVLAALLKLGSASGAEPFVLRMTPATPVAEATEPAAREVSGDEPLRLPEESRVSTFTGRPLTGLTDHSDEEAGEAPIFYRPFPRSAWEEDVGSNEPVCDDLGDFPKSSKAIFPLPKDYFNSYDDTWGAPRPQGGHEGSDLMSPTGTPEFAITDGTIVPVSGANKNGWNRLGGYTVMLEAAYDVGPVEKGDLFYYAHMDRESALPVGTKVRAGQRIGVAGDTGEGREATRGKFPPHLHLGWYDTGSAESSARSDLESGAMNPYPLLSWLEANGGAVSGGEDAAYCEAPPEFVSEPSTGEDSWLDSDLPGTSPDLDTGSAYDPRPSPVVEESRHRHDHSSQRESEPDEGDGSGVFGGQIGAVNGDSEMIPTADSEGNDETAVDPGETPAPDEGKPEASEDQASRQFAGDVSLEAKTREKDRSLPTEPRSDHASRPSYASTPADVLRKKEVTEDREEKNAGEKDRDGEDRGKDRGEQDEKKQDKKKKKQKKTTNLFKSKEPEAPETDRPKPAGGERTTPTADAAGRDRTNDIQHPTKRKLTD